MTFYNRLNRSGVSDGSSERVVKELSCSWTVWASLEKKLALVDLFNKWDKSNPKFRLDN